MIDMDLADEATATALVVRGIFNLGDLPITPFKQVLVGDLDLAPVANEVEAKLGVVKIPLEANPTIDPALRLNDLTVGTSRRTAPRRPRAFACNGCNSGGGPA